MSAVGVRFFDTDSTSVFWGVLAGTCWAGTGVSLRFSGVRYFSSFGSTHLAKLARKVTLISCVIRRKLRQNRNQAAFAFAKKLRDVSFWRSMV